MSLSIRNFKKKMKNYLNIDDMLKVFLSLNGDRKLWNSNPCKVFHFKTNPF